MRKSKGITLISLIITIVILLLLAGITISTIKQDGIIEIAQKQQNELENELANKNSSMQDMLNYLNNESNSIGVPDDDIEPEEETPTIDTTLPVPTISFYVGLPTSSNYSIYKTGFRVNISTKIGLSIEYSLDNGDTWETYSSDLIIMKNGIFNIKARYVDEKGNYSKTTTTGTYISADTEKGFKIGSYVDYDVEYTHMDNEGDYGYKHTSKNGWRYFGKNEDGDHLIISTGVPMVINLQQNVTENELNENGKKWWDLTAESNELKLTNGLLNNINKIPYKKVEKGAVNVEENSAIGLFEGDNKNYAYVAVGDYFNSSTHASKIEKVTTFTIEDIARVVTEVTGVKLEDMKWALNPYEPYVEYYASKRVWYLMGEAKGLFNFNFYYSNPNYRYASYVCASLWNEKDYGYNKAGVLDLRSVTEGMNVKTGKGGLRPVIVLSSDVTFEDTNGDGVYEIIY